METVIFGNGLLGTELNKQSGWAMVNLEDDGVDITDNMSYHTFLRDYDTVINCIGYTDTGDNTRDKHWAVNYKGVIGLVDRCNIYGVKLVHMSTDYIYANANNFAKESDVPVHYDNWYTYTKLLADGYVQAMSNDYLMFRTSFKPNPFPWDAAWQNLQGNFDYVDKIVPLMIKLIDKGSTGVYNIGGGIKTMYELAKETNENVVQIASPSPPYDVSMDLSKYEAE